MVADLILDDSTKSNILNKDISEALYEYMADYSKDVIMNRAIPDLRDGLKPSHRYFLWQCYISKIGPKDKHVKLVGVAGSTLAFHPHASTSIELAAVGMSQDWIKTVPLVDIYGNNGSIDGSPAAASRYIKARYSEYAKLLIGDIDDLKDHFLIDNYDGTHLVPAVYPSKFPVILMNEQSGIGVGMSTDILPQDPQEMVDCTIAILQGKAKQDVRKLYTGPAFPSGGLVVNNKKQVDKLFEEGLGKFTLQSSYEIDEKNNQIIIKDLPLKVTTDDAMSSLANLIDKYNEIEDIEDLTTGNHEVNIVITCKKSSKQKLEDLAHTLISRSACSKSLSANHLMIAENTPQTLGIYDTLYKWSEFRIATKMLELAHAKSKLTEEIKKLNYRILILDHQDELLDLLMKEKSLANTNKIFKFKDGISDEFSEILKNTTLSFLTKENSKENQVLRNRKQTKDKELSELIRISQSKEEIKNSIIQELKEIAKILPRTNSKIIDSAMKTELKAVKKVPTLSVIAEGLSLANSSKGDTITDENLLYVFLKSGALLKYNSVKLNSLGLMNVPLNRVIDKLKASDKILYCCSDESLPDSIIICSKEGRGKRITKETLQKLRPLATSASVRQYHKEEVEYFTTDEKLTYKIGSRTYELHNSILERNDSLGAGGRKCRKEVK